MQLSTLSNVIAKTHSIFDINNQLGTIGILTITRAENTHQVGTYQQIMHLSLHKGIHYNVKTYKYTERPPEVFFKSRYSLWYTFVSLTLRNLTVTYCLTTVSNARFSFRIEALVSVSP